MSRNCIIIIKIIIIIIIIIIITIIIPDLGSASDWSMLQGNVAIIKVANFCQEVLNPLGSYSRVFTVFKPLFTARRKHYST